MFVVQIPKSKRSLYYLLLVVALLLLATNLLLFSSFGRSRAIYYDYRGHLLLL